MRKLFVIILLSILTGSQANAQADKSNYCPDINQIDIRLINKPWTHIYEAFNNDHKYFVSHEYVEDANNGPAPPIGFAESSYDPVSKTLSCVYIAFTRSENSRPTLVNVGDY